jgi:hypothetical protein
VTIRNQQFDDTEMPSTPAPVFRLVPRRTGAFFWTVFYGIFLIVFGFSFMIPNGHVTVNGREVYGEERQALLLQTSLVCLPIFCILVAWHGRRLLPDSPFDFLEFRRDGLAVGGLFGRRHLAWEDISAFSVGIMPLSNPPAIWVKAEPRGADTRPMRFFMGGYVNDSLFGFSRTNTRAVAAWLDRVREAYVFDSMVRSLPPPPEEFVGRIIKRDPNVTET